MSDRPENGESVDNGAYFSMAGRDREGEARDLIVDDDTGSSFGGSGRNSMSMSYWFEKLYSNRGGILGLFAGVFCGILFWWSVNDMVVSVQVDSGKIMAEEDYLRAFKAHIIDHGKVYPTPEERDFRYSIFKRNLRFINAHNGARKPWRMEMNRMGDMLPEERQKSSYGLIPRHQRESLATLKSLHPGNLDGQSFAEGDKSIVGEKTDLAEKLAKFAMEKQKLAMRKLTEGRENISESVEGGGSTMGYDYDGDGPEVRMTPVDWRETGCMPAIKDQGQCGSCWAFAAVTAVEADVCIREGIHELVSEQQVVDCALPWPGCDGGTVEAAWSYMKSHDHGICLDRQYPYQAKNNVCNSNKCQQGLHIEGAVPVQADDDDTFKLALKVFGPITIAIDASGDDFTFYKSGIFEGECGTELNHAVIIVGWGIEADTDQGYWIMQNSWGVKWGEHGYMKMPMGHRPLGKCGLMIEPAVPLITRANQ